MREKLAILVAVAAMSALMLLSACSGSTTTNRPGAPGTPGGIDVPPDSGDKTAPVITGGIYASVDVAETGEAIALSVTASDDVGGALTFSWSDGGAGGIFEGSGAEVTYKHSISGNYTIKVVVSDAAGNKAETSIKITITPPGGLTAPVPISLHGTSSGMQWWYERPDGFGALTGIPYNDTGCNTCHVYAVPGLGTANGCDSCHGQPTPASDPQTCLRCHARQGLEFTALGFSDVHRDAGMACMDCHTLAEVHGDGSSYESMHSPGQFKRDCESCHRTIPMEVAEHQIHNEAIHCTACHDQTVVTCYNCHFDSLINDGEKKPYRPFANFVILANDSVDGKIKPATYQSVVFEDKTFAAFGPYHGHTVTAEARTCADCHNNAFAKEFQQSGKIVLTEWDEASSEVKHAEGVIPFVNPSDFEMQFVTFDKASNNWSPSTKAMSGSQFEFITPLTPRQIGALAANITQSPFDTLPISLHGTSQGMQWWYERPDGFGSLTGIPYNDTGCNTCHVYATPGLGTANGCDSCHAQSTPVDDPQTCLRCHARQGLEIGALALGDVHRDAGMNCVDCHGFDQLHGDGNSYSSMHEEGASKTECMDCHSAAGPGPAAPNTSPHTIHNNLVHCSSCHVETEVTCYNCHFESLIDSHEKKQYQAFSGFMFLAEDSNSGLVKPATYQAVTYQDKTFVAFGPYHGHSVMKAGRGCADCHGATFQGNSAVQQLKDTGKIAVTRWDPDANGGQGAVVHIQGIVPFLPDKFEFQFMDFNPGSGAWSPMTTELDKLQYEFITPLSPSQMSKIGYTE